MNPRDANIAPPATSPKTVDWEMLCQMADGSRDVVSAYAFGGSAPTTIKLTGAQSLSSSLPVGYTRLFVEFTPYAWNPANPSYNGA
jgi:hypothetical protein